MPTLQVKCVQHNLTITNSPVLVSGSSGVDSVQFSFCSIWDGYAKTAVFYLNNGTKYYVLLSDDACNIPTEVLSENGTLCFGVFGIKDSATLTSEILKYNVGQGAYTTSSCPAEPTAEIYTQIDTLLDSIEDDLTDVVTATTTLEELISSV